MEEMQVLGTQTRQPNKLAGDRLPVVHLCNSNLPSQSFYPCSSHYPYMYKNYSSDWEIFEAVRIQELEEVKARAAQMEKTMRWWSDCTANWREKWSKVRAERNKAREEAQQLRIKLDSVAKELSMLKKINQDLVSEKENVEKVATWKTEFSCPELSHIKKDLNQLTFLEQEPLEVLSKTNRIPGAECTKKDVELIKDEGSHSKKITPKPPDSFFNGIPSISLEEPEKSLDNSAKTIENDLIYVLRLHLAKMQKILQKEREMNVFLEREMEKTENELFLWKWKYEELRQTKLESLKQLQEEANRLGRPREDKGETERTFPGSPELERLQFENTSEWGKRERLEAEKQNLEEENRRMKLQSEETEESQLRMWDQMKFLVCCWRFSKTATEDAGDHQTALQQQD